MDDLYYMAKRPRDGYHDAKSWLLDCFDDEDSQESIRLANVPVVIATVEREYEGGYVQFLRDGDNCKF